MNSVCPALAETLDQALGATINALASQLMQAQHAATGAAIAHDNGDRPLAMGTLIPLERLLPDCQTLLTAIFVLRRWYVAARDVNGGAV